MKKLLSFITLCLISVSLFAQSADSESNEAQSGEITFNVNSENSTVPQLVIHRGGLFDLNQYKLLDGTKLSSVELNKMLKTIPENESLLRKKNFWMGADFVFCAGAVASLAMNMYANNKGWENATYYSAVSCFSCLAFAACSGLFAHSYKARAVDNYNLSVMGIPLGR